ncbi:hypothetical protein ABFS82_14G054000 [Erythranthe guttata]|uniref:transcription initiation factor TFIID subunit 11-like n=1 Tax=Erythranthe guttata TaxID=4155 RepID=UPI00064E0E18|nr:PREDICTED: transcription initiation factor TFIID subunit 11-like [Erythranthe guttata]|eukprot:XP_012833521.1 PREDICTED: transcription initiation factor TFIID subunit 11-like [Erythranthe guttata]
MEFGDGGGQDNDFQSRRGYNQRPKDSAGGGYNQPGRGRPANEPLGRTESNRTLLDIIREEGGSQKDSRKTWRHFKDKLRRRNSGGRGSTWTSTVTVPTSDIPLNNNNRMIARHPSTRINSGLESDPMDQPNISAVPDARMPSLNRNPSRAIERASGRFDPSGPSTMKRLHREEKYDHEDDGDDDEEAEDDDDGEEEGKKDTDEEEDGEERPVRMSLMSLLAETDDDQMGLGYMMDEEDDDDDDDNDGCGAGGAGYNNCCVCMVRHKGTAFVPCGHSFCRLCSRELWVERGNCPLCNNYILEILDIF